MYRPRSLHSDIGDVEIIEHQGRLHMFHLVIPNRDLVGHAVSPDGLSWTALPPAVRTGDPGDWDDDMIRTVSVTERAGRFYMLYSATCRADGGAVERTCGAVSDDLMHWEKLPDVAGIAPDERFYEGETLSPSRVPWRDPKPFFWQGRYYCVLCARENKGPLLRRGAVALMVSDDLIHWTQHAPLYAPGACMELECPQIYRMDGRFYLIASLMEDSSQRYWVADALEGPYRVAGGDNLLAPPKTHYAGRIARFQGRDVFACWTFANEDGPSPFGLHVTPGALIKYVPAVLDLCAEPDGRLTLRTPAAWDAYAAGAARPLFGQAGGQALCGNPHAAVEACAVRAASGMEMLLDECSDGDFTLRGTLTMTGYKGGVVFHVGEDGSGYLLELYPAQARARLVKHFPRETPQGNVWFDYRVMAETSVCLDALARADGLDVLARAVGGEIEISLGGAVRFATVSTRARAGRIGLFAEDGAVRIHGATVTPMRAPENR